MPSRGHPDGHREGSNRKGQRSSPHGGAVQAMQRHQVVGDHQQNQDSQSGHGTGGGRHSHLVPWKTAEGGIGEGDGSENDQALMAPPGGSRPRRLIYQDRSAGETTQGKGQRYR